MTTNNQIQDWLSPLLALTGQLPQPPRPTVVPLATGAAATPPPPVTPPQLIHGEASNSANTLQQIMQLFGGGSGLIGRPGGNLNISGQDISTRPAGHENDHTNEEWAGMFRTAPERAAEEQRVLGTPGSTGNMLTGTRPTQNPVQLAMFQQQAHDRANMQTPDAPIAPPSPWSPSWFGSGEQMYHGNSNSPAALMDPQNYATRSNVVPPGPSGAYINGKRQPDIIRPEELLSPLLRMFGA